MSRTAVIAGVGPTVGEALAHKFVAEDCSVALLSRSVDYVEELAETLDGLAIAVPTDITDPVDVHDAFERVREELGPVDVLVNNASAPAGRGDFVDRSPEAFEAVWRVRGYGSYLCSQEAARDMIGNEGGTILFSGTSFGVRGSADMPEWGSGSAAARGLARSMARALGPEGIHVIYVVLDGPIGPSDERDAASRSDRRLDRDAIAEAYWHLVEQPSSAWTMELDLGTENRNPES